MQVPSHYLQMDRRGYMPSGWCKLIIITTGGIYGGICAHTLLCGMRLEDCQTSGAGRRVQYAEKGRQLVGLVGWLVFTIMIIGVRTRCLWGQRTAKACSVMYDIRHYCRYKF
jgi:hypothetical protein